MREEQIPVSREEKVRGEERRKKTDKLVKKKEKRCALEIIPASERRLHKLEIRKRKVVRQTGKRRNKKAMVGFNIGHVPNPSWG